VSVIREVRATCAGAKLQVVTFVVRVLSRLYIRAFICLIVIQFYNTYS